MTEMKVWTDDRVEQLKKLFAEGFSAQQIAIEMGGVTRNAVIGKVFRLGLTRTTFVRVKPTQERKIRPKRNCALTAAPSIVPQCVAEPAVEPEQDPIASDNVVPLSQRLSLFELNDAVCHWPVGDPEKPDFFFCGGKSLAGLPYCAHHCRVAYAPLANRRHIGARH